MVVVIVFDAVDNVMFVLDGKVLVDVDMFTSLDERVVGT